MNNNVHNWPITLHCGEIHYVVLSLGLLAGTAAAVVESSEFVSSSESSS